MWEKKENNNLNNDGINIDSTNIFDEFWVDEKLKEEIELIEKEKSKDSTYYLKKVVNFFIFINITFLLFSTIFWIYIYIQNDKTIKDVTYLMPVCDILVDDKWDLVGCSSVSALISNYENINKDLIQKYFLQNMLLIESIYKNLNFVDSREVWFLINKSKSKIHILKILSEFDKLKSDFSPLNKTKIKCSDLIINWNNEITIKCSAFSWIWDWRILWYSWKNKWLDKVHWTSISVASSFINFIEKAEKSHFLILEKPKKFNFTEIVDNNGYTRKTDFTLKLKYNNISLQNK